MEKKRNLLIVVTVLAILISFILVFAIVKASFNSISINDFEIDALSEAEITELEDYYQAVLPSDEYRGELSGINTVRNAYEIDRDEVSFSSQKMTGMKIISASRAKDCILKLDIAFESENKDAVLVVIKGTEVLEYFVGSANVSLTYASEGDNEYVVKLLSEGAKVKVDVKRTFE